MWLPFLLAIIRTEILGLMDKVTETLIWSGILLKFILKSIIFVCSGGHTGPSCLCLTIACRPLKKRSMCSQKDVCPYQRTFPAFAYALSFCSCAGHMTLLIKLGPLKDNYYYIIRWLTRQHFFCTLVLIHLAHLDDKLDKKVEIGQQFLVLRQN